MITGASGLIGVRLARALAPEYQVVGFDVDPPPDDFPAEAAFVECDLTSDASTRSAVRRAVEEHGPLVASVVHLAAYYDFSGEPSSLYEELTVEGTRRLLVAVREQTEAEQFVFSSSLLVMKPAEDAEVLTERSAVQAEWDYPESKLDAEAVIEKELGGDEPFIKPWMIDLADAHYPVSIERARTRLGWEPRHRLRQVLPSMIARLEADPEAWYRENALPVDDDGDGKAGGEG